MADLVLVVEDDPANAVLVQAILSSVGGYDVIRCKNYILTKPHHRIQ